MSVVFVGLAYSEAQVKIGGDWYSEMRHKVKLFKRVEIRIFVDVCYI